VYFIPLPLSIQSTNIHMKYVPFLLFGLSLFLTQCDTGLQEAFIREASQKPVGVTRTDKGGGLIKSTNGTPIEEDKTDWRSAPFYTGYVRFNPAFPNPISSGFVTIPVIVTATDQLPNGLTLRGYNDQGRFILLDEIGQTGLPGAYTFNFDISLLSASGSVSTIKGIHRLFIFDRLSGEMVSYGDLLVE